MNRSGWPPLVLAGRAALASAAAALALAVPGVALAAPLATSAVPFQDPSAQGWIGLCNQQGQQITSGWLSDRPFAWRAVSSQSAPSGYRSGTITATLYGFVAMRSLPPGDWGGEQLTASSRYSNPDHPMAQSTAADEPLHTLVEDYPPEWDGFYELRLYLGAAGQSPYSVRYPALAIQVNGDSWQAVGGGKVDCSSGQAVSDESLLLPASKTSPSSAAGSPGPGAVAGSRGTPTSLPAGHTSATSASTNAAGAVSGTSDPAGSARVASGPTAASGHHGSTTPWAAVAVAALAALAVGLGFPPVWRRLRRSDGTRPDQAS